MTEKSQKRWEESLQKYNRTKTSNIFWYYVIVLILSLVFSLITPILSVINWSKWVLNIVLGNLHEFNLIFEELERKNKHE